MASSIAQEIHSLKMLSAQIESLIKKETGAEIEWTFRGKENERFTISGAPHDVNTAVAFSAQMKSLRLEEPIVYDEELDTSFAYLCK
ncbi:hypothetical protein [Chromobacterium vaccinii]|uniref:hypothetical protein n=1 Tax=Chromobacterium vaccinii TaxID=1108595 RepID=UPI000617DFEE|nr:hypothetical protein [Chromobacterium vaccinii]SUX53840.1 Uncharacterised protein [Chromobacterium vaccinii]